MAILDVQHIEKHFGDTHVLEDISFSLEEGQALSIIGSSGSGKTTLLRCLNFLETPDKGVITVRGEKLFDADDPATRSESEIRKKRLHFGMVFQSFNLFPQYTALENVTLARELMAKSEKTGECHDDILAEGKRLLADIGLADRMSNYPHQLSGGQQQRVAIARALAMKPDILCFDEPTSGADRRGAPGDTRSCPAAHHHDHRHPRDALCPRCGGPHPLHGRRCRRGGRKPRRCIQQSVKAENTRISFALSRGLIIHSIDIFHKV